MKMLLLTLAPVLLLAQPTIHSRVLDYEPDEGNTVLHFRDALGAEGIRLFAEPSLRFIALYADSTEKLDRAEQMIRKYYKPKPVAAPTNKNVELYFYLLHARTGKEPGETLVALNPVLAQLRQLTPYQSFDLLETLIVRSREGGKFNAFGALPWKGAIETISKNYNLKGEVKIENSLIFLTDLILDGRFLFKTTDNNHVRDFAISSSISFKPGQFAVVGKTNVTPTDGAMILVVTARVVD